MKRRIMDQVQLRPNMVVSSPWSTMVRLFALRNESQHGYQRQIFEPGDSMEVQSTLSADDSTYSRNDVEQLRGSVQIEHSGSHGRPSNEHLMWPSHHRCWLLVRGPGPIVRLGQR
jgi:hypothetical protein